MKTKIFATLLFSLLSLPTFAQLISQPTDFFNINSVNGQSFTAPVTTQITKISVRPGADYSGTLYLYNGSVGSGTVNSVGTPAYTQTGVNLTASSAGVLRDVVLTTPFPVVIGSEYTFVFSGPSTMGGSAGDAYANGTLVTNYASLAAGNDLVFQIWNTPVAAATPAAIPTLGAWGLILMSGSLAMLALMGVGRSKSFK